LREEIVIITALLGTGFINWQFNYYYYFTFKVFTL